MKKAVVLAFAFLLPLIALSQRLTNNGAVISIGSGKYVTISGTSGDLVNQGSGNITVNGYLVVQGDWTNNANFTAGTGLVKFNGVLPQEIKAGGDAFNKVILDNTAPGSADINLTDAVVIADSAMFINGIVYFTGTGSLTFTDGAVVPEGGSANSFVDTPGNQFVTKTGTNEFIFPVGEISGGNIVWAPVGIDAPAVSSSITANYDFSPSLNNWGSIYMCDLNKIEHVSGTEHWNLSTTGSTPPVTLYWKDGARSGITNPGTLSVAQWNGSCWESLAVTVSGTASSGSITTNIPFTSNDTITFGTLKGTNPLPVVLLDFTATCAGEGVILNWSTASENNNDHFNVEQSSDAYGWKTLGQVAASGNSSEKTEYSFTDNNLASETKYYRLKQTDYNGEFKYFAPVAIRCGSEDALRVEIYPNPFLQDVNISISNITDPSVSVSVYNILGKKIIEKFFNGLETGHLFTSFEMRGIACGMYYVEVQSGDNKQNFKIVKNTNK